MVTTLQSRNVQTTSSFRQGNPSFGMRGRGGCPFIVMVRGESLEVEAFLHRADGGSSLNHRGPTLNLILLIPSRNRGISKTCIDSVGEMGHLKRSCPCAKRQGAVSGRECMNSLTAQRHSPTISKATSVGGKKMASNNTPSKFLNPDPWTRLIGSAQWGEDNSE